jgi:hypothetical protein
MWNTVLDKNQNVELIYKKKRKCGTQKLKLRHLIGLRATMPTPRRPRFYTAEWSFSYLSNRCNRRGVSTFSKWTRQAAGQNVESMGTRHTWTVGPIWDRNWGQALAWPRPCEAWPRPGQWWRHLPRPYLQIYPKHMATWTDYLYWK